MKQKLLTLALVLVPMLANAYPYAWIDGIYYELFSDKVAKVYRDGSKKYSGRVVIPEKVKYNGKKYKVIGIESFAFADCANLESITIPGSITTIGDYAFSSSKGLTSITIPGSVTTIGKAAFFNCKGLTSITIPGSVKTIGEWAFIGCEGLTSITIPNSVRSIGKSAFSGCEGLTSITIPGSVKTIGESAFIGCEGLTSVTISDGVESLGKWAFCDCKGLTSITIPGSVKTIGESAFRGCEGLSSVTIPNSVRSIGKSAFSGCEGLTSITIPGSVTTIGESTFAGCKGLTSINVVIENTKYDSRDNCNAIIEKASNTLIVGCKNTTIPGSVTSIGNFAYSGCDGLNSFTIPSHVMSIGVGAFANCKNLTSINVEAGNTKYDSRDNCNAIIEKRYNKLIAGCMNTTIPNSVTTIGDYAFSGCDDLTAITIPSSVRSIGKSAFSGCDLTSITIPGNVASIGESAFSYCHGLTSITLINGVTSIGEDAFKYCESLVSITIPNSLRSIGKWAFLGCKGLVSVTIPKSVTSIDKDAFEGFTIISRVESTQMDTSPLFESPIQQPQQQVVQQSHPEQTKQQTPTVPIRNVAAVDSNIPVENGTDENTFAVIIGNEKYKNEADVPYALNDAKVFSEYVTKTLGVPKNQVRLIENASLNEIKQSVRWLTMAMDATGGTGKIIFYYAGHGIPDEATHSAYLLPTDGMGSNVEDAYSLERLYSELSKIPSKRVMVFLDACFSGAKRDGEMLASARGVAIKARASAPKGKMIVFSAAQGDETAYPYEARQHGLFTYYLLKKIQETKGDITLGDLSDYLIKNVKKRSFTDNKNNKMQTPSVNTSPILRTTWQTMKLK